MHIRPCVESDLEALVHVFTQAVHIGAAAHYDAAQRQAWAPDSPDLNQWRIRFESVHMLVAEENGEAIGFLSYEPNGHIDLLFTSPTHARQGVASALYRDAQEKLIASGLREVFTEASHVARPFFEKHGFHVVEEENVTRNGVVLTRFRMRKTL